MLEVDILRSLSTYLADSIFAILLNRIKKLTRYGYENLTTILYDYIRLADSDDK